MRQVAAGNTVRVHYVGTLADGTGFASSVEGGPIEVTVGGDQVVAGFEAALLGMAEDDTKSLTLAPKDAYGLHDPRLVHMDERARIPIDLKVGAALQATNPGGHFVRPLVVELDPETATLDANHLLAGKTLTFKLELVGFVGTDPPPEEIATEIAPTPTAVPWAPHPTDPLVFTKLPSLCPKCKKEGCFVRKAKYDHYGETIYRCTHGCRASPYPVWNNSRDPTFHFAEFKCTNEDGIMNTVVSEAWEEYYI